MGLGRLRLSPEARSRDLVTLGIKGAPSLSRSPPVFELHVCNYYAQVRLHPGEMHGCGTKVVIRRYKQRVSRCSKQIAADLAGMATHGALLEGLEWGCVSAVTEAF